MAKEDALEAVVLGVPDPVPPGRMRVDCGPRAGRATATTGAGDAVTSGRGVSSGEAAPCLGAWLRLGDIATTKPRVKAENHFMFTLELYPRLFIMQT